MSATKHRPDGTAWPQGFTTRETAVVGLLAEGLAAAGIANRLGNAPSSAKWYLRKVFPKLGVHTHDDAVVRAKHLLEATGKSGVKGAGQAGADLSEPGSNAAPAGLPSVATPMIGRREEQVQLLEWLNSRGVGLVTITGAAGCGKTRLALAVADRVNASTDNQVYWIDLTPITDPALVDSAIASALTLRSQPGQSSISIVAERFNLGRTMLVLDNCEHLAQACSSVSRQLLAACPRLHILATSRVSLTTPVTATPGGATKDNVQTDVAPSSTAYPGIRALRLEPLPVPPPETEGASQALSAIADVDSVRLFTDRAKAALPSFTLGVDNASAVARICRTLD